MEELGSEEKRKDWNVTKLQIVLNFLRQATRGANWGWLGGRHLPQDFQNDHLYFLNFIGLIDSMFNMYTHIKL